MPRKARRFWTATELARVLGVTQHAVRYWYHWGWLPGIRVGRKQPPRWIRFKTEDVEALLQRRLAKRTGD